MGHLHSIPGGQPPDSRSFEPSHSGSPGFPKLYVDGSGGALGVDFRPEADNATMDCVGDVYTIFDKSNIQTTTPDRLISVQVLESDLSRSPLKPDIAERFTLPRSKLWAAIFSTIVGPTIATQALLAVASGEVIEGKPLEKPGAQESRELRELWLMLHKGIFGRLFSEDLMDEPYQQAVRRAFLDANVDAGPEATPWVVLKSAIGLPEPLNRSERLAGSKSRQIHLPQGFLKRVGLTNPITLTHELAIERVTLSAVPSGEDGNQTVSATVIGPMASEPFELRMDDDGLMSGEITATLDPHVHISPQNLHLDFVEVLFRSNPTTR